MTDGVTTRSRAMPPPPARLLARDAGPQAAPAARPAPARRGDDGSEVPPSLPSRPSPRLQPRRWPRRRRRRPFSKLTARVLAINVLALLILVGGVLYLGRYEDRLMQAELESLRVEAQTFAGALAEGATVEGPNEVSRLDPARARAMVRRLYETTDTRTRLFDVMDGSLIADSRLLAGPGGTVEIRALPETEEESWPRQAFDAVYAWVTTHLPRRKEWPPYAEEPVQHTADYISVQRALRGEFARQIWTQEDSQRLLLGVAVPVQRLRVVIGAVLVTRDTADIEAAVQSTREEILLVFLGALGITVLLSLYLAGTITRPIRRLAEAAEQVRRGHGRQFDIPDFTRRRDELGELSGVLRDMTAALWKRMDAIERFAADVAHEIKNPLTSVRSAVETVVRIDDPEKQRRLLAIIVDDVERLNRLISDISDASRLDSELSRAQARSADVRRMLQMLVDMHNDTNDGSNGPRLELRLASDKPLLVSGVEDRLVQVFRNIVTNAITFSPPDGTISLAARRDGRWIEVTIEDEGPGIPEGKLDAIFDRFYSERPAGEKFGTHSGLGLSISRQIVEAHQGRIFAENRKDRSGARFTVRIPAE